MPKILKRLFNMKAEPYRFLDADEIVVEPNPKPKPEPEEKEEGQAERKTDNSETESPVDYAKFQADAILKDARREAGELMEEARRKAEDECEKIKEKAREEGYNAGYAEGMTSAAEETKQIRETQAAELESSIKQFLEKATHERDRFMDQTADDLRDLAIAVAEKVIRVSLKSSSEVIGRMIMAATDKHKREEWVHIYIANCDAETMAHTPPALAAALAGISDRVRIIPMADDESGTCIIEMPDEIIDASASTQISNIKTILSNSTSSELDKPAVLNPEL